MGWVGYFLNEFGRWSDGEDSRRREWLEVKEQESSEFWGAIWRR